MLNPHIFRAYDIRGIAHVPVSDKSADLTPESIELIGKAAGTHFKRNFGTNLVVSRDCRLSNPELSNAFIKGVLSTGCDVTEIGMAPTPMMYWAVCNHEFDGGVAITASHNPKEYNGVKLVGKGAYSICGDEIQTVYNLAINEDFETGEGRRHEIDIYPEYQEHLINLVHLDKVIKVVIDAGNGATAPFVRPFFEALGCEVIALYDKADGAFPNHPANPEELENMQDLIDAVQDHNADLGIGFDGDGDRVGVVDENGKHYTADWLVLLLARDLLSRNPGAKVVFDVKVSQLLIDDIKKHGGEPVMHKTGCAFIKTRMKEIGALLGGEISGHMLIAENYYGFDDAFLAAAKMLEILSKMDKPFSELFADVPETACTPEFKSSCPDDRKFEIVKEVTAEFVEEYDCITIDGVRVNFDEKSWGAVRCSNTSPNLTIRLEAPNEERLSEIKELMLKKLRNYPEIDLWWNEA